MKTIPSQDLIRQRNARWERLKADPTCSRCKQTKTLEDFPSTGVDYWCLVCRNKQAVLYYHNRRKKLSNPELLDLRKVINKRQKERRDLALAKMAPEKLAKFRADRNAINRFKHREVRDVVFKAYGGYKCVCCGETEKTFLSIDHINNDGAKHKREYRLRTSTEVYRWLVANKFPSGFQVLCMNCQWGKRNNDGVCPHSVRRNDYPEMGVGPSGPKRNAPHRGDDIVCSVS